MTLLRMSPLLLVLLAACSAPEPPAAAPAQQSAPAAANPPQRADVPEVPMPGSDRDSHGCIGSAGYRWCSKTQQCERPWELAKQQGFDNTSDAFDQYCGMPDATSS
ncbi:hypothetical protein [Pseudoxanthomonas dokdonensis]|uniref:Peptidase n=1 Tax=Pseudoxanthomonas dokdonensis TaxID=344882 RepID=A0A0R0CIR9_9GAMM|nr:hypothetical protein [Pseudoxanthomonas dokdonensis]KRG69805.1 hypothetical protein ABB29_08390 [Pseudoxanthomonas dokdonensis]